MTTTTMAVVRSLLLHHSVAAKATDAGPTRTSVHAVKGSSANSLRVGLEGVVVYVLEKSRTRSSWTRSRVSPCVVNAVHGAGTTHTFVVAVAS